MEYLFTLAIISTCIAAYFDIITIVPIIEQDGKYWVIRIRNRFVDAEFVQEYPTRYLHLVLGSDSLDYPYCRFATKELAELYFNHVCDYTAEGKYRNI